MRSADRPISAQSLQQVSAVLNTSVRLIICFLFSNVYVKNKKVSCLFQRYTINFAHLLGGYLFRLVGDVKRATCQLCVCLIECKY